ncbi:CTP synthase (glutamine hydrolyzing) [Candidatus Woesearchaeota archaeon]|nr:CTP synthase (glutamine hydrolyzing) [Candidatus Woesearchaeota archaeon]
MVKYIIVTGGVLSGLGKGIATASIGHLLSYDYKVVPIKCDGYLNVDPGTMNPVEHGEVFVLDDGTEVDMDFGHYERFLKTTCTGRQNLTMGKVFHELHEAEREGKFLGKTVQLVPHASGHIVDWWRRVAEKQAADVCLIEVGGTVGDMENELYLEAARQLRADEGKNNVCFVHLTYVPIPGGVNEQKSKPTQQSVKLLMERGISPTLILPRCREPITENIKKKIATFCNVEASAVISAVDVDNVYKIPLLYYKQGILNHLNEELKLQAKPNLDIWTSLVARMHDTKQEVNVAICGKYTALEDSYASVVEALRHSGAANDVAITISWIDTEAVNSSQDAAKLLADCGAVIVPGGFGSRGIEGKINVVQYCRENNIPYLGLCYGLQLAVIEFMRNVVGKKDAHTTEVNPKTTTPIVDILPDKKDVKELGGTLRLGAYPAILNKDAQVTRLYGGTGRNSEHSETVVSERHRHRYEVNPEYHEALKKNGLCLCGLSPDKRLVEFIELPNHSFFMATQAHPELKSSLECPAPLFVGLIAAAKKK